MYLQKCGLFIKIWYTSNKYTSNNFYQQILLFYHLFIYFIDALRL